MEGTLVWAHFKAPDGVEELGGALPFCGKLPTETGPKTKVDSHI